MTEDRAARVSLETVRAVAPIYALSVEPERLAGLKKLALTGDSRFIREFSAVLLEMREPKSLDLIIDFYQSEAFKAAASSEKYMLTRVLGRVNDSRAIPVLFALLESQDESVRSNAASILRYSYPGTRNVNQKFLSLKDDPKLGRTAKSYLNRFAPALADPGEIKKPQTPWLRAVALKEDGDNASAAEEFLQMIRDASTPDYALGAAIKELLPIASENQKKETWSAVHERLKKLALEDRYGNQQLGVEALASFKNPKALDTMLAVLERPSRFGLVDFSEARRIAAWTVYDFGPEARQQAAQHVLRNIENMINGAKNLSFRDGTHPFFLQAALFADHNTMEKVLTILASKKHLNQYMASVMPLRGLHRAKDEGAFLTALLRRSKADTSMAMAVVDTAIYRLGQLREDRAVPELIEALEGAGSYQRKILAQQALENIGAQAAAEQIIAALAAPEQEKRKAAAEVLSRFKVDQALPLARRMLQEPSFGDTMIGFRILGQEGQKEDLTLLGPYADFWKASDRQLQYWALQALGQLRERLGIPFAP